jgi:hypothetical protein
MIGGGVVSTGGGDMVAVGRRGENQVDRTEMATSEYSFEYKIN